MACVVHLSALSNMAPKNISQFRRNLLAWFKAHHRQLPWRETNNPYHIWVSEVMLQQTQAIKVVEYYQDFVDRFPTLQHLAKTELDDVLKQWEGLGYYARARNLRKAAKILVDQMDGEVPADYDSFRELPGVGDYTAAAVQSIAFNNPYAVVDGNVKRVVARLFLIGTPVNQNASAKIFQSKADSLLDGDAPGRFNQAMMELGSRICRPKSPLCVVCPVNDFCDAFRTARQDEFPVRVKSKPTPEYHIAVGVIYKGDRVLITRRKAEGLLGGLWEFPGGKVEQDETAKAACVREIREEVGLSVEKVDFLTRINHAYSHFRIGVDVFRCHYRAGEVVLNGPVDYRWIRLEEIDQFPFPRANHKFIPLLKAN